MKAHVLFKLAFITTFFVSCIKENVEDTVKNSEVYPEYSLPLGTFSSTLDTSFTNPGYILTNSDTVALMYNGTMYYTSAYSYYDSIENFNINFADVIKKHLIALTFRTIVSNYCPSDIYTQVYFLDGSFQVQDSVFSNGMHKTSKGTVNSSGEVTGATTTTTEITFEGDRLDSLLNCYYFEIKNKIYYYNSSSAYVKFTNGDKVEIIAGVRLKLKFSGTEIQ